MRVKTISILGALSVCLAVSVFADPVSLNQRPRMMSMGGAGLAAMGDYDSAIMNPAGLNDVSKSRWNLFDLTMQVPFDYGILTSLSDFNDKRTEEGSQTVDKKNAFYDFLKEASNKATATRVSFYPSYTRKNFHVGLLADVLVDPRLRVGGLTSDQIIELGGSNISGAAFVGYSHSFLKDNALQVGLTLKPIYRVAVTENQEQTVHDVFVGLNPDGPDVGDEIFGADKLSHHAFGFGVDLGAKYALPFLKSIRPSVGITYQDVGDTRFFTSDPVPTNIPQSVSIGVAVHPDWKIMRNTIAFDFRNLQESEEILNKIHMGAESILFNLLALRVGLEQGYICGGLGILTRIFQFDAFISAQEAGRKAHIQALRTFGTRISLGF